MLLVRHADHGHAVLGQLDHGIEHLTDPEIESRGRLVEQHDPGLHAERSGDRHTFLLPAGQLARVRELLDATGGSLQPKSNERRPRRSTDPEALPDQRA